MQLETKYLYQNQNKSTNIYNSLEIKQFDCSYNNYNRSYISYKISKMNQRKIGNFDFDFIVKDLSKQFTLKEKKIKNKLSNTLEKSKIRIIKKCKLVKKKIKKYL